ncbi:imelysin family protein [Leptospira sp. 2 VSF19]|uniref:Imelysin family protein n=1 Tax=Leptospira soteropolitanensis TaxID=2950025 RepID=A0AAW5VE58_9LEPT|nr:imelysin family protein [Leptospira soteropolitanensis]MCW7493019.1 imelysin family protein [Leptospira soteropolitanensis]MCW7500254.1 imelysin family protein [Leptospira soteropolitanensis]MCW7522505.1 imelysin family protein [Leptospira soteropolitanensis]MCW7526361.1 imelysin family protein [Leptospira soteropolitanensis]MCW7529527.1 imelysin family protein [Leptospira soteropolitanensis]
MKNKQFPIKFLIYCFYILLINCGSPSDNASKKAQILGLVDTYLKTYTTSNLLLDIANNLMVPKYAKLDNKVSLLQTAAATYTGNPDATNLTSVRNAWTETYLAYKQVEWAYFGPANIPNNAYLYLDSFSRAFPIDTTSIESKITANSPPNGLRVDGLDAVEYLLFKDNVSTTNTAFADANRKTYLTKLIQDIKNQTGLLTFQWDKSRSNSFYYSFTNAGKGSRDYPNTKDGLTELTNQMIFFCNTIIDIKIAEPSGLRATNLGVKDITKVETPYANLSFESLIQNLQGFSDIGEAGFYKFLSLRSETVVPRLKDQIQATKTSVNSLKSKYGTFQTAISTGGAEVELMLNEFKKLRILISTEVISSLGGTIGVSSNDGD